jgi:phenylacetate-CoA ligase
VKIFPKSKLRYFRQLYYFAQLKKHQLLKERDQIRVQEKKLRALINHAYENVPYYHQLFDSVGIKPQNIQRVKDLQKIPILSKEDIRKNFPDNIIAKGTDITKCHTVSTTGSTGIPLKFAFSSKMYDYTQALYLFSFTECGLRLTDKLVGIYHRDYQSSLLKVLLNKIGFLKWENIPIFNHVESILESLKRSEPDVISAYPSMLSLLSKEIRKQNISGINPRFILAGGETLTVKAENEISEAFKSKIFRTYGAEEFSILAFECKKHSGYHIISDAIILEILKNDKYVSEGEEGEIIVTGLINYTMPLIRYKLGDIGTFTNKKCTCGSGYPLIKNIEGRTDDFLILPSGRKISPRVINVIEDIPGVSRYKTVQEAKDRIVVNLVSEKGFSPETINEIKKHIKAGCLGEEVKVVINLVDELSTNRRGKLRAVISNVQE